MLFRSVFLCILLLWYSVDVIAQQVNICYLLMDTSVNNVGVPDLSTHPDKLLRIDKASFQKAWNQVRKRCCEPFEPVYFVSDKQYIMLAGLEGSGITYCEVGYGSKKLEKRTRATIGNGIVFVTGNRIELGISEGSFRRLMPYIDSFTLRREMGSYVLYDYQCGEKEGYYQQGAHFVHRPVYIARYLFFKGKLIKYGFGYLPFHPTHEFDNILF